jgi:TetR/AcrR family transcriptional regulator, cholesterol catabolism regulator
VSSKARSAGGGSSRPAASGAGAPTRSLAKSAATRRRVLSATATVLLEKGYAGARLADIAKHADLQAGSLYYYFSSKEQLVEEVLRYGVQWTHAHVRAAVSQLPESASPGERLETAAHAHLEAMLELGDLAPAHVRTFHQVSAEMQSRLRPMRRAFGDYWAGLVNDAIASGEIRDDVDPYVLRLFLVNSVEKVSEWPLRTRHSAEALWQIMREMIFTGLATSAAGHAPPKRPASAAREHRGKRASRNAVRMPKGS